MAARYRFELSHLKAGRITIGGGPGLRVVEGDELKIQNDDAKKQAGLATELDPDNERYREWLERFE